MSWINWLPALVTFFPLLGVAVLLFLPREKTGLHRFWGIMATLPSLFFALYMYLHFDQGFKGLQWFQSVIWFQIPILQGEPWTFHYSMGVDGLSLPLIVLTTIVSTLAAVASLYIRQATKGYYQLLLLLETGMIGVFAAANLFLFFIFFEITLIVTFFLIGKWGFLGKVKAANRFLLYNGLGSGFLLFAMVALMIMFGSLEYSDLESRMGQVMGQLALLPPQIETTLWAVFIALMIAFSIKLPVFPFHSWMLRTHVEAPTPVVMIHSGVLLKMGAYGFMRFGVGLFPEQMKEIAVLIAILGLINILYGALLAIVQRELKSVLAYSSISHMGIILFGLASLNAAGLKGVMFQAVSHGLISALLFFLVGCMYERTRTTELDDLGGLAKSMPVFSGIFLVGIMALLGLPGLSGFISEFLSYLGLFQNYPVIASIGALGLIFTVVYALRALLKTTFGPIHERYRLLNDLNVNESVPMMVLVALIVLIGVYPDSLGAPMQVTLDLIVSRIGG
ncbi:complex I subunit 4 family protein [Thermoactinomyces mirandus]|uniref:NADH-quinone oxidoreductase subunit M n=1 Tax=Thermoactinomyces mirandus TaxID=2756294 RepID=A0A7W1XTG2_9BACL|nr:NADH-quinone oxidoreductase subunit M [Thermoactinomyces mirandus]MBA4602973.1 NADH-quinone oxidoreductase subunit M [Thermoactinomyces mirandus]